jgi:hypothetical protein
MSYRIMFVTEGARTASLPSGQMSEFDDFVTAEAHRDGSLLQSLNASWYAFALPNPTNLADAQSHYLSLAGSAAPIYLVDGTLVAQTAQGILQSTASAVQSAINLDQFGASQNRRVWTGLGPADWMTSENGLGANLVWYGWSTNSGGGAFYAGQLGSGYLGAVYGISSELIVPEPPAAIPEPGTFAMVGGSTLLLLVLGRRRMRNSIGRGR